MYIGETATTYTTLSTDTILVRETRVWQDNETGEIHHCETIRVRVNDATIYVDISDGANGTAAFVNVHHHAENDMVYVSEFHVTR